MKHRMTISLASALSVLAVASCGGGVENETAAETRPEVISMNASWVAVYSSVEELKANSDLAVSGIVSDQRPAIQEGTKPPLTSFVIDVNETLWSREGNDSPEQLIIDQGGGFIDGVKWEIHDDPLFSEGEQTVLFVEEFEEGSYRIIGGPSGRYVVEDGVVMGLADSSSRIAGGVSLEEFADNIRRG